LTAHDPPEVGERHLDERSGQVAAAGVREAGVDPPEGVERARERLADGLGIGDVAGHGQGPRAVPAKLGLRLLVAFGAAAPVRHVGAGLRETAGDAEPDARVAAGDDRHLAVEIQLRSPGRMQYP
jgi:hypothetical protein